MKYHPSHPGPVAASARLSRLGTILLLLTATCMCSASVFPEEESSVLVQTTPVQEKTLTESLPAFGVLDPDPDQVVSLSLPRAGLINRVWVRLGQRVKAGDKLLEVITAPDAHMQFLQAQGAVDFAQNELERQQRLLTEQLSTKSQVDAADRDLKDAQSKLSALRQRGEDLAQETLTAPVDGIITQLDVAQGQRVQADSSAMLIASEKRLIARLGVEPEDLSDLKPGTPVTIGSVFVPDVKIESEIREVHAMVNPDTLLVEVLAAIPEDQISGLVLGSRLVARIHLSSHSGLVVPGSAILGDDPNFYVFTVENEQATQVPVTVGTVSNDVTEISGNIKAGDWVVVSGNYQLSDGMMVRVESR